MPHMICAISETFRKPALGLFLLKPSVSAVHIHCILMPLKETSSPVIGLALRYSSLVYGGGFLLFSTVILSFKIKCTVGVLNIYG